MDKLLQGQIAGVSVQARSGRPGESAKIRIRGTNTITGNAEPLWVVDGVPLQKNIPLISTGQIKAGDFSDIFTNGVAGINETRTRPGAYEFPGEIGMGTGVVG